MNRKAVDALKAARVADSQRKRRAVLEALADARDTGTVVSVSTIAQRAGVSRQFVYSHDDLRAAVRAAADAPTQAPPRTARDSVVERGLRADKHILSAKVERQRITIADLRSRLRGLEQQRQRWLGSQLERSSAITPEEHAELRATCDRLLDQNRSLSRKVAELERLNAIREADLAASRQAHAEDLAAYGGASRATVVSLPDEGSAR